MIIWLASFPRSGNTLLRQVLAGVFHLPCFSDEEADLKQIAWSPAVQQWVGMQRVDGPWTDFYRESTESAGLKLVKTHRLPCDDQPAIYVVRDGRSALTSYDAFHQSFTAASEAPDLMELVLGLDFYGSWSDHFRAWMGRRGNTLLVRYEDLVNPTPETLGRLAEFIKVQPIVESWHNPFEELHSMEPRFFRRGVVAWEAPEVWTTAVDQIFLLCHGDLMVQLGYCTSDVVAAAMRSIAPEHLRLVEMVHRLGRARAILQKECDQRLSVIEDLKAVCDERLALINRLHFERS